MRTLVFLFCFTTALFSHATDESTTTSQEHAVQTAESEKLIASAPTGWQHIYALNTEKTRLADFIPGDETELTWKTKVSFESHKSLIEVDPISVLMGELDQMRQNCEKIQSFNLFSGVENGYPTSARLTFCGENAHTGEGEVTISKAIQGNAFLYLIKMLHRVAPFDSDTNDVTAQQIASWSDYFGKIIVCDSDKVEHACEASISVETQ